MAKKYTDKSKIENWTDVSSQMSPKVLEQALAFCEANELALSQLINSSVKVFISEANEYFDAQKKQRSNWMTDVQEVKKGTKPFRITKALTTADALKSRRHFSNDPELFENLYGSRKK